MKTLGIVKIIAILIVSAFCANAAHTIDSLLPLLGIPAIIIWAAITQKNENDFDDYIDKNQ